MRYTFLLLTVGVGASGGRRLIYRCAEELEAVGHQCGVVYNLPGRVSKEPFESEVKREWVNDVLLRWKRQEPEVVVVPEYVAGAVVHNLPPHLRLIMFVQNAHVAFHQCLGKTANPYLDSRVDRIWVVSEHSRELLCALWPELREKVRLIVVDAECESYPVVPEAKERRVVWLPRKTELPELYERGLRAICERHGYELRVVDGVSRQSVLEEFGAARYFVPTSLYESCPMPVIESLMMGCVPVGYCGTGVPPRWMDYAGAWATSPLDLFVSLDEVLGADLPLASSTVGAREYIRTHFTAEAFRASLMEGL